MGYIIGKFSDFSKASSNSWENKIDSKTTFNLAFVEMLVFIQPFDYALY